MRLDLARVQCFGRLRDLSMKQTPARRQQPVQSHVAHAIVDEREAIAHGVQHAAPDELLEPFGSRALRRRGRPRQQREVDVPGHLHGREPARGQVLLHPLRPRVGLLEVHSQLEGGVARGLVGEVLGRIERKGFRIVALEQRTLTAAVRLNEKLIAGNIQGQRTLTVKTGGQSTTLQFTLFVVPN